MHIFSFVIILFCISLPHETVNLMGKEEFEKIDKVIRRERLYANVGLMRENVMARFFAFGYG